jgi:hypothetical protein
MQEALMVGKRVLLLLLLLLLLHQLDRQEARPPTASLSAFQRTCLIWP